MRADIGYSVHPDLLPLASSTLLHTVSQSLEAYIIPR